jgi:hypothetical protein
MKLGRQFKPMILLAQTLRPIMLKVAVRFAQRVNEY